MTSKGSKKTFSETEFSDSDSDSSQSDYSTILEDQESPGNSPVKEE